MRGLLQFQHPGRKLSLEGDASWLTLAHLDQRIIDDDGRCDIHGEASTSKRQLGGHVGSFNAFGSSPASHPAGYRFSCADFAVFGATPRRDSALVGF